MSSFSTGIGLPERSRAAAISQHLAALKDAGLVCERRDGRFAYYRSDPRGLDALADWVKRYRVFWPARMEKLKRVLKDMDR